ncbi:MAG: hypothetical protein GC179_26470 [Anaerolineaceae bacterium]|nr:hypothetical protein [Anaerolineaceae bacterium]
MAFQIEWLPNEPILIATASGLISVDDFKGMYEQVASMIEGRHEKIYRIADYTNADSSFMDILKAVKLASNNAPGSSSDPRIQTVYVGTSQWISLARTALQQPQFGGIMIPTFVDLDDALVFARREIAKAAETASA